MESHPLFRYSSVTGAGISYSSSYPIAPSIPNRLSGPFQFAIGNSPNSPFSNQFDCDTITTLSDSTEQYSPTENLSGASPSCNSSLESNNYFHHRSPSLLQDANSGQNIKHRLLQLETALMGPDDEDISMPNNALGESSRPQTSGQRTRAWCQERQGSRVIQPQPSFVSRQRQACEGSSVEKYHKGIEETGLQSIPPDNLKQLLIACAKALSENNINEFDRLIEKARAAVSISGEPIQRLGAYLVEGLVARKESSGNNIYHALRCREPESKDLLSYMQILYEICPYLKFGYMAANGAIAEACKNENRIHIIDFQIAQGTQWITLLQALAAKPGGAPHVRITGIDDPVNKHARGDGLEAVHRRLATISEKFNIPIEFHGVPVFAPDVTQDMLDVRPGEALAVNFPLQLHHTPDESVDVSNPRDGLLRMIKSLNPKVVTLVEQESNTNTTPFLTRFMETLDFYLAMFESIDVRLPRERKDRIGVEQHCLAKDIVNIIACEGKERVERHELFGKWKSRLTMAGFRQYPLSSYVNSVIRSLLRCYSEHYTLLEKDGAMLLGWKNRNLVSASAWY
ncbi:chitin-inducible gibberellin-responsive protein 1-like [Ricinus communis]|uniref:chitin-inducible gibberellin-responsive protein 1-like n=1 Tax=Ricinus communis TaxID=3988 RepID=UPI00201A45A1|nr:chitin-inducible gibberellin-responsive protein 1-like [Ricinus communis]XP_048235024.1 chitin-inducible gibberellin-responsive protein 1-like [Ricinus communis]